MNIGENRGAYEKELVLLIHGTASHDPSDTGARWWQRQSQFWRELGEKLGPNFECQPVNRIFHWSGANSERHRRAAAGVLADWLLRLENNKRPYHLIGHSHGGSVIWLAMRMLTEQGRTLEHLRSWATIGTPFLHYRARPISLWWLVPALGALLCLGLSLSHFRTYAAVIADAVRDPSGWPLSLITLPLLWLIPLTFVAAFGIRLVILLYSKRRVRVEHRAAEQAYRSLWDRYLGLWCHVDEAIGGLASTMGSPGSVVPRMQGSRSSVAGKIISAVASPVRAFYNAVIARASDEFIWDRVTRRLQGSDRLGYELVRVHRGPLPFLASWPQLPEELSGQLIVTANSHAAATLASVRNVLGLAAESTSGAPSVVTGLTNALTDRELIHTSYFSHADIHEILRLHIEGRRDQELAATSSFGDWIQAGHLVGAPNAAATTVVAPHSGVSKRWPVVLPALLSGVATSGLALAWLTSSSLYESSLHPYADEYQIEYIVNHAHLARVASGPDITGGSLRHWASSLTRAGYADQVLFAAAQLASREVSRGPVEVVLKARGVVRSGRDEERLLIMSTVVHELFNSGQRDRAQTVLNEAFALVRSNPPSINDEGFRAVARELAHLARGSDALFAVERLSPDRKDWKAEGLSDVALGYADAGHFDEALATIDNIEDLEQRSRALRNLIAWRPGVHPAKRRALDVLLALAPKITDVRNWQSDALRDVTVALAELGDTHKALEIALSIPNTSFRAGALIAVAKALLKRGEVKNARQIVEEALVMQPKGTTDLALVLVQIDRSEPDPEVRRRAMQILEEVVVDARQQQFFPETAVGAVAKGWAELGESQKSMDILATMPLSFYKHSVLGPFKSSIARLVALGKTGEVDVLVRRMPDPTRKAFGLIALALASDDTKRRALLMEVEKLTPTIPSDDDASFVLSEVAKAWAKLHQYRYAVQLSGRTRAFDRLQVYQELLDDYLGRHRKTSVAEIAAR